MTKKIITILSLIIACTTISYGQTISDVFMSVPENVFYGLDVAQKETLLSDSKDTSAVVVMDNNLYEEIRRIDFSKDFISLKTSKVGTTQIKLLPLINDSKIICVVKTACRNICDSEVSFYTTKWIPIAASQLMSKPDLSWFIKTGVDVNSEEYKNAVAALDLLPVKITLSPDEDSFLAEYSIKEYLSKDEYERVQPFLIDQPRKMIWDKTSFK